MLWASVPTTSSWPSAGRARATATRRWLLCCLGPDRRPRSPALTGAWLSASLAGGEATRGEVLGHGPPEGHQSVTLLGIHALEERGDVGVGHLHLGPAQVESARRGSVAGEDERAVVDASLGAEALCQPSSPGALLAARLVARPGHHVGKGPEDLVRVRRGQAHADEDVLVGESQKGPAVLVAEQQPHGLLRLGGSVHG